MRGRSLTAIPLPPEGEAPLQMTSIQPGPGDLDLRAVILTADKFETSSGRDGRVCES